MCGGKGVKILAASLCLYQNRKIDNERILVFSIMNKFYESPIFSEENIDFERKL